MDEWVLCAVIILGWRDLQGIQFVGMLDPAVVLRDGSSFLLCCAFQVLSGLLLLPKAAAYVGGEPPRLTGLCHETKQLRWNWRGDKGRDEIRRARSSGRISLSEFAGETMWNACTDGAFVLISLTAKSKQHFSL